MATVTVDYFATAANFEANTSATALPNSFNRGWKHTLSDAGSFSFSLAATDAAVATISYGGYVRFKLDGTARFAGIVEDLDLSYRDQAEEFGQILTVRGRGVVAEWERATVQPSTPVGAKLYADERLFGWQAHDLNKTGFASAVNQFRQDTAPSEAKVGTPVGWPDPLAYWVWSEAGDTPPTGVDPGVSYLFDEFTVSTAGRHAIYLACDDAFVAYLDGVSLGGSGELNGWRETYRADVYLSTGTHYLNVAGENFTRTHATNAAGLLYAVYELDASDNDGTLLRRSSSTTCKVVHLPANAPGFTAGDVLAKLLAAAQAQGILSAWSLTSTASVDSAGASWPTNQQFSFSVGMDLLSALRQLADAHIDFTFNPADLTLNAYLIGTAGSEAASTSTLTSYLEDIRFQGRG